MLKLQDIILKILQLTMLQKNIFQTGELKIQLLGNLVLDMLKKDGLI